MVNVLAVIFVLIGAFIASVGILCIKKGTNRYSFLDLWKTYYFWLGVLAYFFATIFYVLALRWEALSITYPLVSTTYIWTTFLSIKYLGEKMTKRKWLGLIGIVVGVVLIGLGS